MRPARAVPVSFVALCLVVGALPAVVAAADPVEVLDVFINGNAPATNTPEVTVATPYPGAVTMRLSNDGLTWKSMANAPSTPWSLDDSDAGGTSDVGQKTVYVYWYDGTDTLVAQGVDQIVWDVAPPVESALQVRINLGKTVSKGGAVPFVVTWSNTDDTGTVAYDAERSVDGGSWTHLASPGIPGFLAAFTAGHSFRVRVRGIDMAGNVGSWYTGPAFTVKRYQESSSKITWTGSWSRLTSTSYWGGAERSSKTSGNKARITFTGRRVALVSRVGPTRGPVRIYVNGVYETTVDLGAPTTGYRRVVWQKTWSTSASRTITVKVISAPGRTRGDIDAFVTGS